MIIQKPLKVNFIKGRGNRKPLVVVLHIVGKPGISAQSAYETFLNPKAERSSHYLTCKNGDIWQFVQESDMAWTQGIVNNPSSEIIKSHLAIGVNPNQIAISIEHEGSEDYDITPAQYEASSILVREICQRHGIPIDRRHIIGHREITTRKTCPGKVDINKIIRMATNPPPPPPSYEVYKPAPVIPKPTAEVPEWLKLFLDRNKTFGALRNPGWTALSKLCISEHPFCAFHGGKGTIMNPLQAHHIVPVHIDSKLEMERKNIIVLCWFCHFWHAHLGNFKLFNLNIRKQTEEMQEERKNGKI